MTNKRRRFPKGIILDPDTSALTIEGEAKYDDTAKKVQYRDDSATRSVVSEDGTQTVTNKTIDGDNNTISNLAHGSEVDNPSSGVHGVTGDVVGTSDSQVLSNKSLDDDSTIIQDNGDDTKKAKFEVSSVTAGNTRTLTVPDADTTLVGTDVAQTLTNKTIDGDDNTIQDVPLSGLKTVLGDANKLVSRDGSGAVVSTLTAPSGNLVGDSDSQTLTNKTIDADNNTISNLAHGAEVDNPSSGVHGVTGDILGSSDSQTVTNKTIDGDNNTISNLAHGSEVDNPSSGVHGVTGSVVGTSDTQVLTNKDVDGGTASNTSRVTIPKASKSTLDGLTRKEGTALYATDQKRVYIDDGTDLLPVGSGNGGLDVFSTEDFEVTSSSDLSSGNNATFLGGGTLDGTLADETSSPIAGDRSIKYTMSTSSGNDYIALPAVTLDDKQKGQSAKLSFYSTYDGDDDDIQIVVYDTANSQNLASSLDVVKASTDPKRHEVIIGIPNDATTLRVGFQVTTGNNTKILIFDDIELSLDITQVISNTVTQAIFYQERAGVGSGTSNVPYFTNARENSGANILTVTNNSTDGFFATAVRDCTVSMSTVVTFSNTGITTFIIKNGDPSVTPITNPETSQLIRASNPGANLSLEMTAVTRLKAGENIYLQHDGGTAVNNHWRVLITAMAENDAVAIPNKSANSIVTLQGANGYGSTNTKIRRFSNIETNTGAAITYADSSTNGGAFTIEEDGIYTVSYADNFNAASNIGISRNSTQLTTNIGSITDADRLAGETTHGDNLGSTVSYTGEFEKDDIIRAHGNGTATGAVNAGRFSITKVGVASFSAIEVNKYVVLKDLKTSGTSAGSSSVNTVVTRDLNTVEGDTELVTLSSNQFTLYPGKYKILASAPAYVVSRHQTFLYNVTDSSYEIDGHSSYSSNSNFVMTRSSVEGTIEISSAKTYEIRQWTNAAKAGDGLGLAANNTNNPQSNEVYTTVNILKLK